MMTSFTCPLPVPCDGGRRPGSLADAPQDCSTSETFSPRTVLTENVCRCVQNILQHFKTTMAFLTTSTVTFFCLAQEWHCKDIHSHIHSHTPMHTPKIKINKKKKKKTLNSPNMMTSFTCSLPVQCFGGRRPGSLADAPQDCYTSEAFSPRTVLTENICGCVQNILQHFKTTMAFLTISTVTFSCLALAAPQADSWWF